MGLFSFLKKKEPEPAPAITATIHAQTVEVKQRTRGELPLGADTVRHVRFLNDQVGFVTSLPGDSDSPRQLMRTLDGGRSWEELSIDFSSLPEQRLFSCCLWVESDKVVVGFSSSRGFPDGYQLLSTDFGESWSWREKPASPRPDGSPFTDLDDPAFLPI